MALQVEADPQEAGAEAPAAAAGVADLQVGVALEAAILAVAVTPEAAAEEPLLPTSRGGQIFGTGGRKKMC